MHISITWGGPRLVSTPLFPLARMVFEIATGNEIVAGMDVVC